MLTDSTGTVAGVLLRTWIAAPNVDPLSAVDRAMICTPTWEASGPSDLGTTPHVGSAGPDDTAEEAELEGGREMGVEACWAERQPVSATAANAITAHQRLPRSISTYLRCTKPQAGSRRTGHGSASVPSRPRNILNCRDDASQQECSNISI